ncbi:MAG: hypothetical protein JST00_05080 [Deltaproteobacteria bacterium]|nr:hypothetical protein [Deltaproteobacteria bacterium]
MKHVLHGFALLSLLSIVACEASSTSSGGPGGGSSGTSGSSGSSGSSGTSGGPAPVGKPDFTAMRKGGDCPAVTGAGVTHLGDITSDEVWKASDGVHRIGSTVRILANVTIEACARVELTDRGAISVGSAPKRGALITQGTFEDGKLLPVLIGAADPANRWGAIVVDETGSLDLSYTVISGGDSTGTQQNGGGQIRVFGVSNNSKGGTPSITKSFRSRWALVDGAQSYGVNLLAYSAFTDDSTGIAVHGTKGRGPIKIEVGAVQALPTMDLQDNDANEVFVEQTWSGTLDHTYRELGYPYRVMQTVYLQPTEDGAPAVMTVEPGVTLKFDNGQGTSGVTVGATDKRQGKVVAKGTADKPILMTSAKAAPAAGDWMGIYFRYSPPSGNAFENVTFEYAGANSGAVGFGCGPGDNDATILILSGRPTESWVKNCTFKNGGGQTGIVSGWLTNDSGPDFKATNTFVNMPACHVSRWRTESTNGCPSAGVTPDCL